MTMMITNFNKLLQSKIVWLFFIGLVVFAFVAMDMATPEPNNQQRNDVIGAVFNQEVKRDLFMSSYNSVILDYTIRSGQELRITDQIHEEITSAAWERLAILFKAKNNNIIATEENIRERIKDIIRMISQSDYYDPDVYTAFIKNFLYPRYGISEKQFESFISESIIIEKILEEIDQNPWIDEEEIIETFHNLNDTLTVQYAIVKKDKIKADKINDIEANTYYTNNLNSFEIPEKVKVNYIKFPISNYTNSVLITDQMILNLYSNQIERFRIKNNDESVTEYKSLDDVKDFITTEITLSSSAQKALDSAYIFIDDLYKESVNFISKAQEENINVLSPDAFAIDEFIIGIKSTKAFNSAAFNLEATKDGYYSDPIRGKDNIYIVALEDKFDSYIPSFDEVKEDIYKKAQNSANNLFYSNYANKLYTDIQNSINSNIEFVDVLKEYDLDLQTTEPFSLNNPIEGNLQSEIMRQTYTNVEGTLSSFINSNELVLVYIKKRELEDIKLLDEKRTDITTLLRQQKILELMKNKKQDIINEATIEVYQDI